ncbi:MAG: ATP-dependent sacrificial sulfur transferase LarE [Synergistaceae bacterium]|nr:ATP-dependent sacrificial sulfur transferase LarE [Synergistaceae bacterium]
MDTQDKYTALQEYLHTLGSVAVAFSGGVDSTFLLRVSHDVLGDKAIAITLSSPLFPHGELTASQTFCNTNNITHIVFEADPLNIPGFTNNPPDRCYLCKRALFSQLLTLAHQHGLAHVIEGSNLDDLGDYRPGLKAIDELGINSPLRYAGLTKAEIRALSRELGLPTWDKPSYACLASRFVYGEAITPQKLLMVGKAEEFLISLGFRQMRVRLHGRLARIEVMPEDFARIVQEDNRTRIYDEFKALGFSHVSLDLKGYRTGSMNETIIAKE